MLFKDYQLHSFLSGIFSFSVFVTASRLELLMSFGDGVAGMSTFSFAAFLVYMGMGATIIITNNITVMSETGLKLSES